ncbi:DNA ligase 1-like isoform X2 [Cloeon dipterum]|uniref:DNA ligase 1-like isoform X2 n=1 Tax=Cloeon dipterum TaxID=197152 RepID=UPI00321FC07A
MVKNHEELVKACGQLNLNALRTEANKVYKNYLHSVKSIEEEAIQWANEVKNKLRAERRKCPMPPRTPTLKRNNRKRKIPDKAEVEEKENSIAVHRKVRGAAQAAASKFHDQLHVPVKLRRPTEKLEPAKMVAPKAVKKVRVMSTTSDSDDFDDAASVASSAPSTRARTAKTKKKNEPESENEAEPPKMATRGRAKAAEGKKAKKPVKKRKLARQFSESEPEEQDVTNPTSDETATDMLSSQEEDLREKTPEDQPVKSKKIIMSREVTIKNAGTESPLEGESDEQESSPQKPAQKRKSSRNKRQEAAAQLPSKAADLKALTPHIAGKVKERVMAVEQSLQKGYPRTLLKEPTVATPHSPAKWLKAPKERVSEQESASDIFSSDTEASSSPSHKLRKKSVPSTVVRPLLSNTSTLPRSKQLSTNTIGRSRIVSGKVFTLDAQREQAQQIAQELEKKKELERQQREEKMLEAQKKKEELLKQRMEEKKKINEERQNKVRMMQEQRQKKMEEKEEQRRLKEVKEKELKEHKASKFQELKAKRAEKKKLEEVKKEDDEKRKRIDEKRKEDEDRKKEEDDKRKKLQEERRKKEEDERKAAAVKKAVEAKKAQMNVTATISKEPAAASSNMNSTFTKSKEVVPETPKPKAVARIAQIESYDVTPSRDEMPPQQRKSENNYGIDEVDEGDSSDDDEKPKKQVPHWAERMKNNIHLDCADYVKVPLRNNLFGTRVFKPTIQDLFGVGARPLTRRSSAVWNTPPNLHHMTLNASLLGALNE